MIGARAAPAPAGGALARSAPWVTALAALAAFALLPVAAANAGTPDFPPPVAPFSFQPVETERCLRCHGLPEFLVRDSLTGRVRRLSVPAVGFRGSAHGRLACTQCHPEIVAYPHRVSVSRRPVGCDADCHALDGRGVPVRHEGPMADVRRSAHRGGLTGEDPASPTCTDCHGAGDPHAVAKARDRMSPAERMALCAPCHEDTERLARSDVSLEVVAAYRGSFHYQAIRLGSLRTAVCQDCHGVHRVIAADDTASSVSAVHRVRTCGQQDCHEGPSTEFAMSGASHLALRRAREPVFAIFEATFVGAGAGIVVALAIAVALDARRRIGRRRAASASAAGEVTEAPGLVPRLSLAMRLQHGALAGSFLLLALTGLPLRFPEASALAVPLRLLGGLEVGRALHRGAALTMVVVALAHLLYAAVLLARARFDVGRAWPMLPRGRDVHDAWGSLAYDLGLRAAPPALDRHHFREKIHYMAVMWGVPVMALSGLVLWFPMALAESLGDRSIGLAFIAHRDEALIAIAIVAVWHLYVVLLSPGRHHRLWTLADGRITRAHWLSEHRLEAERVLASAAAGGAVAATADVAGGGAASDEAGADTNPRPAARRHPGLATLLVSGLLIVGLAFRIREALRTPLWFDELFTLWVARHPLPEMMALLVGDVHPPLPTLLLAAWRALGGEATLWLKTLQISIGMLTLAAMFGFARRVGGTRVAVVATGLLALHPEHIYFSQELRSYGQLTLALLLAAWGAWAWLDTGRRQDAALWVAGAALALHTHYLGFFVLGVLDLYLLVKLRHDPRRLGAWALAHVGVLVLVLPLAGLLPRQLAISSDHWMPHPRSPAELLGVARKICFGAIYAVPPLLALAAAPCLRSSRRGAARFAGWMAVVPIVGAFTLTWLGAHLYTERYMFFTLPYWCIAFALGLDLLRSRRGMAFAAVALMLFAARAAVIWPTQREAVALREVARRIGPLLEAGDPVFCVDTHSFAGLDHHLRVERGVLITIERDVPYYRGGAMVPMTRRVGWESVERAALEGRRWWALRTNEGSPFAVPLAARLDSMARGGRVDIGPVTIWAGTPGMLPAGQLAAP